MVAPRKCRKRVKNPDMNGIWKDLRIVENPKTIREGRICGVAHLYRIIFWLSAKMGVNSDGKKNRKSGEEKATWKAGRVSTREGSGSRTLKILDFSSVGGKGEKEKEICRRKKEGGIGVWGIDREK